jgi:peptidyl-prolyl cis-trans isomerase SurA
MRAFRSIVFLFLSATLPLSAAELLNGVAVIVNDNIITYQDVQQFLEFEIDGLERRYGTSPRLFQEKVAEKQKEALEQLVERELILHEFKKAGYVLPESVIDNLINEEIREKFGDRATLTRTLQAQGKGFESWKEDLRNRIIVSEMRRMNVNSEIIISPHKIENYYVYHRDRFKLNDQVRLRMINLSQSTASAGKAKELGMQILQKIKEGSSFRKVRKNHKGAITGGLKKMCLLSRSMMPLSRWTPNR